MIAVRDVNGFCDWLADRPAPGTRCQYHRGDLACDRHPRPQARELNLLADTVLDYSHRGKVTLVQIRLDFNETSYVAEATGR